MLLVKVWLLLLSTVIVVITTAIDELSGCSCGVMMMVRVGVMVVIVMLLLLQYRMMHVCRGSSKMIMCPRLLLMWMRHHWLLVRCWMLLLLLLRVQVGRQMMMAMMRVDRVVRLLLLRSVELVILLLVRCRGSCCKALLVHFQSQTGQVLIVLDGVGLLKARQNGLEVLAQGGQLRGGSRASYRLERTTLGHFGQRRGSCLDSRCCGCGLQYVGREHGITRRAKGEWA